jgi:pimeloyl-ACP methyl ester carboxylesterase
VLLVAGVSSLLFTGLATAESSGATTSESTVAEGSVAATPDTVAETSIAPATDTMAETSVATPETAEVEILPPDESFAGATLGEWGGRWMQWSVSLPTDVNPGSNTTGEACAYGQDGPVFFLPWAAAEATWDPSYSFDCVVPEGTAIYLTRWATNCSSVEAPPWFGGNEEELRACLEEMAQPLPPDYEVSINGQAVADVDSYRVTTPAFTINVPEDVPDGWSFLPPGVALAMLDIFGFIIAPPPPGEYLINVTSDSVGLTYTVNVTVEAPQIFGPPSSDAAQATEGTVEGAEGTINGLFDVGGGRDLYLKCVGTGSPTIVYLHGGGGVSLNAGQIPSLLSGNNRVCVYDRANVGWSDPAPGPRTLADAVEDLHTLLDVAEVPGPYALLGASLGGDIAFTYAGTHPDDVVGLVLLDSSMPGTGAHEEEFAPPGPSLSEDELRNLWRDDPEQMDFSAWYEQLDAAADNVPAVPALLLVPDEDHNEVPPEFREAAEAYRQLQEDAMALFDPGEVRLVASPHYMEPEIPEEIAAAVREVIGASTGAAEASATSTPTTSM